MIIHIICTILWVFSLVFTLVSPEANYRLSFIVALIAFIIYHIAEIINLWNSKH